MKKSKTVTGSALCWTIQICSCSVKCTGLFDGLTGIAWWQVQQLNILLGLRGLASPIPEVKSKLHVRVPANEPLTTDRNLPPRRQQPSPPSLFPTLWPKGISYLCQAVCALAHSVISPHYHRFNLNLYPCFVLVNNRVSELKLPSCYRSDIAKKGLCFVIMNCIIMHLVWLIRQTTCSKQFCEQWTFLSHL